VYYIYIYVCMYVCMSYAFEFVCFFYVYSCACDLIKVWTCPLELYLYLHHIQILHLCNHIFIFICKSILVPFICAPANMAHVHHMFLGIWIVEEHPYICTICTICTYNVYEWSISLYLQYQCAILRYHMYVHHVLAM
jgi:hypothetical protein